MVHIENVSLSPVKTAIENFGSRIKRKVPLNFERKNHPTAKDDEFSRSGDEPKSADERTEAAVKKFNAANELKMVHETNFFAELDNGYDKLLQEYKAYKKPVINSETYTPISEDTVSASCNGKPAQITFKQQDDGNKSYEIMFNDGSQVNYLSFANGGKMKINGEEFEMPEGTVVETKMVKDRVFSQLIQTPYMTSNVVNMPEGLDKVEQLLQNAKLPKTAGEVQLPKTEYMLDILGKSNSVRALLNMPKHSSDDSAKDLIDETNFLEKGVAEGKIPEDAFISGVTKDGKRILTIPQDNGKYELCASQMRVVDSNGGTKMIARYESGREANGLWVVSYDNGKPSSASHYAPWNLEKPLSTVNYDYNKDNTIVTATTTDSYGNKNSTRQALPKDFRLAMDKGLEFVSPDEVHLGSEFES